jgi:hypothetical protein
MKFKKFWTSEVVLKSLFIFAVIIAVMGMILLLFGCETDHFKKDTEPTLRLHSIAEVGDRFRKVSFIVPNPTNKLQNKQMVCMEENYLTSKRYQKVSIKPRSDKRISVVFQKGNAFSCTLEDDI